MNKFTLVAAMASVSVMAWAKPDNPQNFKMTFDFNSGNPVVTGTFQCPTEHYSWEDPKPQIKKITKVKVIRGCYDLGENDIVAYESDEELEPGAVVNFTDEFGELEYGYTYTYNARIYDEEGEESYGASFGLFYGIKPASPKISMSLGENGSLPVSLTVEAPTTTAQDEVLMVPLTNLRIVEYVGYMNEREIGVINDPQPGKSYTLEDKEAEEGKKYTYRAYASCEYGTSEYDWISAYVGMDAPGDPSDVALAENEDGSITITWKAPENGKNGGYVNPDSFRYRVTREGDLYKVIGEDLTECTVTDALEGLTGPTLVKYEVVCYNTIGEGGYAMSAELMKGPAYQLPFEENFNAEVESYWGVDYEANKKWVYEYAGYSTNWSATDYSYSLGINGVGDGSGSEEDGYIRTYYASSGDVDTMVSSAIDLKEATYPVLSFYHASESGDPTTLTVGVRYGGESKDLASFLPGDSQSEEIEWQHYVLPLEEAAGNEAAIFFTAAVPEDAMDNNDIALDRIIVCDYPGVSNVDVEEADGQIKVTWEVPSNSYGEQPLSYDVALDGGEPVNVIDNEYIVPATRADEAASHTVSVRANYEKVSGKFSPVFDVVPGGSESGIVVIGSESDSNVEYFDLNGLRLVRAMKGSAVIRRSVKADGSVKVEKVIVK